MKKKKRIENMRRDLVLIITGLVGGLFLNLSASAAYDFFMRLAKFSKLEKGTEFLMSFMFIVVPLVCTYLIFKRLFKVIDEEEKKY